MELKLTITNCEEHKELYIVTSVEDDTDYEALITFMVKDLNERHDKKHS